MQTVNIREAKTHLSWRLDVIENGEEIVIACAGDPIATLSAYKPPRKRIAPPGSLAEWVSGWLTISTNRSTICSMSSRTTTERARRDRTEPLS